MTVARHAYPKFSARLKQAAIALFGLMAASAAAGAQSAAPEPPTPPGAPATPSVYEPQGTGKHLAVVELFTSQGCSSCPPADQLIADLTARKDVLPITLPITYWDKLGWKDTLARPVNTERQMAYAKRTKKGRVYTPQMIIDGYFQAVGSRRHDVIEKIARSHQAAAKGDIKRVPLSLIVGERSVTVYAGAASSAQMTDGFSEATVWLFPFSRMEMVHIGAGENRGRSVRYSHVVKNIIDLGRWRGAQAEYAHDLSEHDAGAYGYAAILQSGSYGPVMGAAWVAKSARMIAPTAPSPEPALGAAPLYVTLPR